MFSTIWSILLPVFKTICAFSLKKLIVFSSDTTLTKYGCRGYLLRSQFKNSKMLYTLPVGA